MGMGAGDGGGACAMVEGMAGGGVDAGGTGMAGGGAGVA